MHIVCEKVEQRELICYRVGFYLGDGTGSGKGRTCAAMILSAHEVIQIEFHCGRGYY